MNPNIVVATEFFEFDVTIFDGWYHADPTLVKASEKQIRDMYCAQCNDTALKKKDQFAKACQSKINSIRRKVQNHQKIQV
jgi:hypothetical protein